MSNIAWAILCFVPVSVGIAIDLWRRSRRRRELSFQCGQCPTVPTGKFCPRCGRRGVGWRNGANCGKYSAFAVLPKKEIEWIDELSDAHFRIPQDVKTHSVDSKGDKTVSTDEFGRETWRISGFAKSKDGIPPVPAGFVRMDLDIVHLGGYLRYSIRDVQIEQRRPRYQEIRNDYYGDGPSDVIYLGDDMQPKYLD